MIYCEQCEDWRLEVSKVFNRLSIKLNCRGWQRQHVHQIEAFNVLDQMSACPLKVFPCPGGRTRSPARAPAPAWGTASAASPPTGATPAPPTWSASACPHSRYCTVQYSAVQCSTVQCSAVQYSTVQYSESKHLHFQTNYLLSCLLVIMTVTALCPVSMLLAVISIASGQCGVKLKL